MKDDNFVYDLDGFRIKIRFLFIFLGPKSKFSYVEIGRCMGNLMTNEPFKETAYLAKTASQIIRAITLYNKRSLCLMLPMGEFHNDVLEPITEWVQSNMKRQSRRTEYSIRRRSSLRLSCRKVKASAAAVPSEGEEEVGAGGGWYDPFGATGRVFGALVKESGKRYRQYWSDIRDGLSLHCVIAAVFTFTICLTPTLTFGGILALKTDDWFGVNEMLIAVAANGLFFALFSGQPLMIFGSTGPMLLFEEMLYIVRNSFWGLLVFCDCEVKGLGEL